VIDDCEGGEDQPGKTAGGTKDPGTSDHRRGRSVVSALHAHIVFVTKYRRGVLSERALAVLQGSMREVCHDFGARLSAFEGEDDHVHLLVEYPPTVQLSRLVNSLKGVSARRLRQRGFPEISEKLWGEHLWSPSYFVASCGGAPLDIVKRYVEDQRNPAKPRKPRRPYHTPPVRVRRCSVDDFSIPDKNRTGIPSPPCMMSGVLKGRSGSSALETPRVHSRRIRKAFFRE
jgi:putative transposase